LASYKVNEKKRESAIEFIRERQVIL
jgi:hypothetical protein